MKSLVNNTVLNNFLSLSFVQAVNMLLPLLVMPYLFSALGAEKFGMVSFVLAVVMILNLLVGFGFEISATKQIANSKNDHLLLSSIFSAVIFAKMTIFLVVFFGFLIVVLLFFYEDFDVYMWAFFLVLGNLIYPNWLFLGLEKMRSVSFIIVFPKIICSILTVVFVRSESDYLYAVAFNSVGIFIGSLLAFFYAVIVLKVKLEIPALCQVNYQLIFGFSFFISRVFNEGARYLVSILIGLNFGNSFLGIYSVVEKLFYGFLSITGVVSQAIYPFMIKTKDLVFFKKIFSLVFVINLLVLSVVLFFSKEILGLFFEDPGDEFFLMFDITFSFGIFAVVSTMIGYPLLGALGFDRQANYSLVAASLVYVFFSIMIVIYGLDKIYIFFSLPIYFFSGFIIRMLFLRKVDFKRFLYG